MAKLQLFAITLLLCLLIGKSLETAHQENCEFDSHPFALGKNTNDINELKSHQTCDNTVSDEDRYITQIERLKEDLDRDGVGVMSDVLTPEECNKFIKEINKWFKKFGPDDHPEMSNSIIRKYNFGYHPATWAVRLKAAKVFASVWGTEKLLTSIDAVAIGEPPEMGRHKFADDGGKVLLHVDQGPQKVGLHAYQGAVYLEEAGADDWCLGVINGSHRFHDEFFKQYTGPKPKGEQLVLSQEHIKWYEDKGCKIRRVGVPKGGIILWDSRTIHAGAPPLKKRKNPNRWRYVMFACMAPAVWASPEEMALRKEAFHELKLTRHWPSQGFETFVKKEMPSDLNAVNELPEISLTEKAKLLVGDLQYDFEDGKPNGPEKPLMHGEAEHEADFTKYKSDTDN